MLLGLTAMDGTHVIRICRFQGVCIIPLLEIGMDSFAAVERNAAHADFFAKKSEPGKL